MADVRTQLLTSNDPEKELESIPVTTPHNIHAMAVKHMPARYESEEEQVSESDIANRDDQFFSSTDADSDIANGDSVGPMAKSTEKPRHDMRGGEKATFKFTSNLPFRQNPDGSRPMSFCAGRKSSLTLRSLAQQQPQQQGGGSNGPGTNRRSSIASSLLFTAQPKQRQSIRSFYSDGLSSDDDLGPEKPFLVATPVAYYVPNSKPNLVSIPTSRNPPVNKRASKKQKKERRSSVSKPGAKDANNTSANMKARLARLRMAKHDHIRSTYFLSEATHSPVPPPVLSNQSTPSFVGPNWGCGTSPRTSDMALEQQLDPKSTGEQSQPQNNPWRKGKRGPPATEQTGADACEPQNTKQKQDDIRPPTCLISGHGRRGAEVPLPPKNIEQAASSYSSPQLSPGAPPSRDKQPIYRQNLNPDKPYTANHGGRNHVLAERTYHYEDAPYKALPSIHSARTGSTSSMASNSSRINSPAFDPASLSAQTQRGYHRPQISVNSITSTSASASERRTSDCSAVSERSIRPPYLAHFGSKSTTNLSISSTPNSPEPWERGGHEDPGWRQPPDRKNRLSVSDANPQHMRFKGKKWLQGTGESVSQASSKAFNGLGFRLKKKG